MAKSSSALGYAVAAAVVAVIGIPAVGAGLTLRGEPIVREVSPQTPGSGSTGTSTPVGTVAVVSKTERLEKATQIDGARIIAADKEPQNWLAHGRTYGEQRYSPLAQINDGNIKDLGVAWEYETSSIRGMEASPIVVDGVMFATESWSKVHALDAATGEELWTYDPQVPGDWGRKPCCDVVNRGVAVWKGRVYLGTLDGRLASLDAKTGKPVWDINTIDRSKPYVITGAPRIVKDKVIIGNGGGELGVRGYITAYDAESGRQLWRFYTVPGDPRLTPEGEHLKKALPTWKSDGGQWKYWEIGGGGTAWDSMAYDPELDLLYVGTGNGSPWSRFMRSPGGGDNLYVSSIVAIKPETGEMVWHYQTTPGDTWDYTATQHMILADLEIGGTLRKVIMQAPKNGFFYVLDRTSGQFISAEPYIALNWATGIDKATGRPIENKAVSYKDKATVVQPSPLGGHNWQPMSFNPDTKLVYIPSQLTPQVFAAERKSDYKPGAWNTGLDFPLLGKALEGELAAGRIPPMEGNLIAWDPIAQKEAWRVKHPTFWNGGTLTTAGNLVFQGLADGSFNAWNAKTGAPVWSINTYTGIIAPPVTYEVKGEQYVVVQLGWGGAQVAGGPDPKAAINQYPNIGKTVAFKLGGKKTMEATKLDLGPLPQPPGETGDAKLVDKGFSVYHRHCAVCHGFLTLSGGVLPDLKRSVPDVFNDYEGIVLGGKLKDRGMASFADLVSAEDVTAVRAYVLRQANVTYRAENKIPEPAATQPAVQPQRPKPKAQAPKARQQPAKPRRDR